MVRLDAARCIVGEKLLPMPPELKMDLPDDLKWENAPFRGQPGSFQHSLVYVLADCLQAAKSHRDRARPATQHCNVQLVLLACAFFEAAMSRGLVNAAQHRLRGLPRLPQHEALRETLNAQIEALFDGETYGNPIPKNSACSTKYAEATRAILALDFHPPTIPSEIAAAVRCLFLLRNMVVHGQTVLAAGTFPAKFDDPVDNYHLKPTKNIAELESHLRDKSLLEPMSLKGGIGFPFVTDAILDHFLRGIVEFFRALQAAITDRDLCHEFGGGLPQHIFPFLAGECVMM